MNFISMETPPTKWQVYEDILAVPYYVIFNGMTNRLRGFAWRGGRYQELALEGQRLWLPEAELGVGLWSGIYHYAERQWLRFYNAQEQWILTPYEQERRRAEQERQRAERLAARLQALGIDPEL